MPFALGSSSGSMLSTARSLSSGSIFDLDETNEEEKTCYSPVNGYEFESPVGSPALPCRKRGKFDWNEKLCCETGAKMTNMRLGLDGTGNSDEADNGVYVEWPSSFRSKQPCDIVEQSIYLLLKLVWVNDAVRQVSIPSLTKALIDYLVETPKPEFRCCQILFQLAR